MRRPMYTTNLSFGSKGLYTCSRVTKKIGWDATGKHTQQVCGVHGRASATRSQKACARVQPEAL